MIMRQVYPSLFTEKKSKLNTILNVVITLITCVLLFELIFVYKYTGIYVVEQSMRDTLIGATSENVAGGDYVYIDKHAKPQRYDIVVVRDTQSSKIIIKRVIAFGGEKVKIINGKLYIQFSDKSEFEKVEENYVTQERNTPHLSVNNFYANSGYLVQENCLFLLGDNRNISLDSRESNGKSFPQKDVLGVVTVWSLDNKEFFSAMHKYFYFDLPKSFGLK